MGGTNSSLNHNGSMQHIKPHNEPGKFESGIANSQQARSLIDQLEAVVARIYRESPRSVRQNVDAQILLRQVLLLSCQRNEVVTDNAEIYCVLPKVLDKCTAGIDAATLLEDEHACGWTVTVLRIIANYSDFGEFFSRTIAAEAQGLIKWMLEIITSKSIQHVISNMSRKDIDDIVCNCLMSLHNITKYPETRPFFRKLDIISAVEFYLNLHDNSFLQCLAMIFSARIAEDSESIRLAEEFGVASSFVKVLCNAVEDQSGRGYQPGELSAAEIADGMRLLLITDSNKSKFVAEGILVLLDKMLEATKPEEQYASIQCLWTLAFSEEERLKISASNSIMGKLETLSTSDEAEKYVSEGKSLKKKTSEALAFIKHAELMLSRKESADKPEDREELKSEESTCVFISYCQKQQPVVLRIREALRAANIECWIDVEQMHGSTLNCMADGIEKCTVALICFSEDYKKSNNCRAEAEYIFQVGKPIVPIKLQKDYQPDGWLGIIIGVRFYIDMSLSSIPFVEAVHRLCAEIRNQLHILDKRIGEPVNAESVIPKVSISTKTAVFAAWSSQDVKTWLETISLTSPTLEKLDGNLLLTLHEMKAKAPEAYYSIVSQYLGGVELGELLAHFAALDRLWQTLE